jgi:putative ABC transport system permease protein
MLNDLRYAVRMLLKNPGFTTVAVLTLALGIGANSAMFSVVNAILLRSLPFKAADHLLWITEFYPRSKTSFVLTPDFVGWQQQNQTLEEMAAYGTGVSPFTNLVIPGVGKPERVQSARVTANFFSLLGIHPFLGREFLPEEDRPGAPAVALLGHGLWQRRFGADPAAVGKTVILDGSRFTVVGVLPADFRFPAEFQGEVFMPTGLPSQSVWDERTLFLLKVIARLKPGVAPEQAASDLSAISQGLTPSYPRGQTLIRAGMQVRIEPLHRKLVGEVRPALLVLLGAVGFVLLIACSNVVNLQLARAVSRQGEIAVRAALGAGRARLVRQLTMESVLLGLTGGVAGLLLALWCMSAFRMLAAHALNLSYNLFIERVTLDHRVLIFTTGIATLTGIASGVVPALLVSKPDLHEALKQGSRRSAGSRGHHRIRSLLVISELAAALVLLVGSGLLIRSFIHLTDVDPGFNPKNVFTAQIELPEESYSQTACVNFFQQLLEHCRKIPEVQFAEAAFDLPLMGFFARTSIQVEGQPLPLPGQVPLVPLIRVSPGYFQTLAIPLISGRHFTDSDRATAPAVAIVNQSFARTHFPDGIVLGRQVYLGKPSPTSIVGIVRDVRHEGLNIEPSPTVFVPYPQDPYSLMSLVVRSNRDPSSLRAAIQEQVMALNKGVAIYNGATLEERLKNSLAPRRSNMVLLGIFAGLAFILALIGIYGVIAYAVTQRNQEIGIRVALGAQRADVLTLVLGQGSKLIVAGILVGLAMALILTKLLARQLYGITAHDPATLIAGAVALALVALLACYIPARRAMKVDPMVALRYE